MATKFCDVDAVLAAMDTEIGYTRDNNLIALYIEQSSELIRQYTRRQWDRAQYTDFLDTADIDVAIQRGRNFYAATLREKPVDVADAFYPKVRYSPSGKWDDATDLDRSVYSVDVRKSQIILYPALMVHRPRSLRVTYYAGYAPTVEDVDIIAVPAHIKMACVAQTGYYVRRHLNQTAGTSTEDGGNRLRGYFVTQNGLIREAVALLKSEVRLLVGGNT